MKFHNNNNNNNNTNNNNNNDNDNNNKKNIKLFTNYTVETRLTESNYSKTN